MKQRYILTDGSNILFFIYFPQMGWELHVANSGEKMRRSMLSRIEILQEARDTVKVLLLVVVLLLLSSF